MGLGLCTRAVYDRSPEAKSIGHSITFPRDIWRRQETESNLLRLSEKVGRRARRHGYMGDRIALILRYSDFTTLSRQAPLGSLTNDTHAIYSSVLGILGGLRLRMRIRLLGVCLSGLLRDPGQVDLMEEERVRKALVRIMDRVNDRWGEGSLTWGSYMQGRAEAGVISPAWKPSGVKHVDVR